MTLDEKVEKLTQQAQFHRDDRDSHIPAAIFYEWIHGNTNLVHPQDHESWLLARKRLAVVCHEYSGILRGVIFTARSGWDREERLRKAITTWKRALKGE